MKSSDIEKYLMKLSEIKPTPLIYLYEKEGIRYLQMAKWEKHQQIRAKRSKYPSLEDSEIISNQLISDDSICPRNPIQSNTIQSESKSESESNPEPTLLEKAVCDFIEFRKKSKKPMTDKAITLFKNKLNKMAADDETKITIIDQSILKGWTDIYPLKDQGGGITENNKGTKPVCKDTNEYSKVGFTL
jgi:hypothetical protein